MECRICGETFYIRRGLLDLFSTKKEYICNRCYKKYPIHLSFEAIQLDRYNAVIIPLFEKKYHIDYNLYYKEYNQVFKANMARAGYKLFFFNHLELDDMTLETLDAVSKLVSSDIIILCLSLVK